MDSRKDELSQVDQHFLGSKLVTEQGKPLPDKLTVQHQADAAIEEVLRRARKPDLPVSGGGDDPL